MKRVDKDFKERVYKLVGQIPKGRLMTYGQVAAVCGAPWAAWEVGQLARFAPCAGLPACLAEARQAADLTAHQSFSGFATPSIYSNTSQSVARQKKPAAPSARHEECRAHDLPWQRVVNKQGGLARGYTWGGMNGHKKALESDGVKVSSEFTVEINTLIWQPEL